MTALQRLIPSDRLSTDPVTRLAHSHGQLSIGEVDRLLYGGRFARVADVVVEPVGEEEVRAIVGAAVKHDACLLPYGGGRRFFPAYRECRTVFGEMAEWLKALPC